MTTEQAAAQTEKDELPVFPAKAPAIMLDRDATSRLFSEVFQRLGTVIDVDPARLEGPTPCDGFTVAELQRHVLAWLQFFAAALDDPSGEEERLDPETWTLGGSDSSETATGIVAAAAETFERAIRNGPEGELVVMAQARMNKEAVLAMALGEYLTHGWDLSVSTGADWAPVDEAAAPALEFLQNTVVPEYRGPDTGFFDAEVPAPADATVFEQLLCFCGRDPEWTVSADRR